MVRNESRLDAACARQRTRREVSDPWIAQWAAGLLLSCLMFWISAASGNSVASADLTEDALFTRFGIGEGLSQGSVTALAQDRRGFLWVGTIDGLNRFDGHEFRVHRADRSNQYALPDAAIVTLDAHPDGSVWAGTSGGHLSRHDPVTDRFYSIKLPEIAAIAVDRDGAVWIGSARGLWYAAPDDAPRMQFTVIDDVSVAALAARAMGGVWIGRVDGTVELRTSQRLSPIRILHTQFDGRPVRALMETPSGELWAAADGARLIRVDALGRFAAEYEVPLEGTFDEPRIRALRFDGKGRIWIGGLAMGVVRFDPVEGSWLSMRHRPYDGRSLAHDDVASLWLSPEGTLWIGTMSGGLNRLRTDQGGILHVRYLPGNDASLSHSVVTAFTHDDDGSIWIGTDGGGLNRLPPAGFPVERLTLPAGTRPSRGLDRIWALHVDRNGDLWVGTWGAGLWHRRRATREFRHVSGTSSRVVLAIHESDDALWIATQQGLLKLVGDGAEPVGTVGVLNLTAIESSGDGRLWIATWNQGLLRFDPRTGEVESFAPIDGDARSLRHPSVRALALEETGSLWVATGAGLSKWDPRTGRFAHFGEQEGLPPGAVYGLEFEGTEWLWMSTNAGLLRLNVKTGATRRFGPDEGAQDFEFNGGAHHRLPDGRLLFGGVNGFNLVDPGRLPPPVRPGPAQIVEVQLNNRRALPAAIDRASPLSVSAPELESLTLGPRFTVVGIRFAAPLPVSVRQLRYAYRLEPFDDAWRITGQEQSIAIYTKLPPGDYRFRVRAGSTDGDWSEFERTFELRVLPHWWASTWAYTLYLLAVIAAVAGFIRWRTSTLRARTALLETKVRDRTEDLARQTQLVESQASQLRAVLQEKQSMFARVSHEFRTPLTLIMGPIDLLLAEERTQRVSELLRIVQRNARRLLRLVDQLLLVARVSDRRPIELRAQRIVPMIRDVLAAFDAIAERKGLHLSFERLDDVSVVGTPELLEGIVANLVSNAVKFTPSGGHVRVAVCSRGDMVDIVVSDDGPGVPLESQESIFEPFRRLANDGIGSGIGLAIVRESAAALGGAVHLESGVGQGAIFTVRLRSAVHGETANAVDTSAATEANERLNLEVDVLQDGVPLNTGISHSPTPYQHCISPGAERSRVLVVENDEQLRRFLLAVLRSDFDCASAADGRCGLAHAIEDPPDLVLSDVLMPDVDGFELTRQLKQDPRTSHVPIILITALADRESRIQGLAERADDYVVKPFDLDELRLRVRNVIDGRRITGQRAASGVYDSARPLPDTGAVDATAHGPRERDFLEKLRSATAQGHPDPAFGVPQMAAAVAMSERQLQRKLRALLDVSPAEYLREYRLQQAAVRLRAGQPAGNVAFDVGFTTPSHFGACFKARFGMTPGEFARR